MVGIGKLTYDTVNLNKAPKSIRKLLLLNWDNIPMKTSDLLTSWAKSYIYLVGERRADSHWKTGSPLWLRCARKPSQRQVLSRNVQLWSSLVAVGCGMLLVGHVQEWEARTVVCATRTAYHYWEGLCPIVSRCRGSHMYEYKETHTKKSLCSFSCQASLVSICWKGLPATITSSEFRPSVS